MLPVLVLFFFVIDILIGPVQLDWLRVDDFEHGIAVWTDDFPADIYLAL